MQTYVTTGRFADGDRFVAATLVVAAPSAADVSAVVQATLPNPELTFIECDPPQTVQSALPNELISGLADQITSARPVQLSRPYRIEGPSAPSLLKIEMATWVPLDQDSPAPFWDRPWCPDTLRTLLFDGPERTYMLLDAERYAQIAGHFDPDLIAPQHKIACLYSGGAAEDLRDVAPYLVDVTLDGPDGSPFLRDYFGTHWGKRAAVFLRSALDFDAMRQHLRRFTRVRLGAEEESWTTFRFWDPAVARVYFPGVQRRADRVLPFFGATDPKLDLVFEFGTDAAVRIGRDVSVQTRTATRPHAIVFDDAEQGLMDKIVLDGLAQQLVDWLATEHPDRFHGFTADQYGKMASHVIEQGRACGCQTRDDFAYLAQTMLTFGGWFHQSDSPRDLVLLAQRGQAQRAALEPVALSVWPGTPQSVLNENLAQVRAHLEAAKSAGGIKPEAFRAFCHDLLPNKGTEVEAALSATKRSLGRLALDDGTTGCLLVLTLLLGHRFYDDPLRPWWRGDVAGAVASAWRAFDLPDLGI